MGGIETILPVARDGQVDISVVSFLYDHKKGFNK